MILAMLLALVVNVLPLAPAVDNEQPCEPPYAQIAPMAIFPIDGDSQDY